MTPPRRQSFASTPGDEVVPKAPQPFPIATAIRRVRAKGYHLADLRADLMAGAVVAVVALPLAMALAIAVGVPPQHGLYTAIVAGAIGALWRARSTASLPDLGVASLTFALLVLLPRAIRKIPAPERVVCDATPAPDR